MSFLLSMQRSQGQPGSDKDVQGVRRALEMISEDPRLLGVAVQTVGSKGYDGFAIAFVTAK